MKFIQLVIHNIASIEDAVIDFEKGPLGEDSLFLICGPTGAGKTTILDAICLALYSTTPRLNIKKVEGYVDEYENFKLGKDRNDIKIDDTRMLMRRGSLNAFVELLFTDKDDQLLKIVWRCDRAYNKPDGNIKSPEWCLYDATTDTLISSKKPDIIKEINQRIGLTFDQFCRTTMLAQGDFTKFLKSDEGEKSQILEKLTGTDIYSEISMRIHTLKSEKELACEKIASRMQGVTLLSEQEKSELLACEDEYKKKIADLNCKETNLTNKYQWISQLHKYVKQIDELKTTLSLKQNDENSDLFKEELTTVSEWDQTFEQRELWRSRMQLSTLITDRSAKLCELQKRYIQLCEGLVDLEQKLNTKLQIQEKITKYLEAESTQEKSYQQIPFIESLVNQYNACRTQITNLESSIKTKKESLIVVQKSLAIYKEDVKKYEKEINDKTASYESLSNQLEKLDYATLLSTKQALDQSFSELKDFRLLVETYHQTKDNWTLKRNSLLETEKGISECNQLAVAATQRVAQLQQQVDLQTDLYEKQQRACSKLMQEYRSMLKEGDTCPLCGQTVQHVVNDEHFISILKPIKDSLDQLRSELQKATNVLSQYKAQYVVYQKDLKQKQEELHTAEKLYKDTEEKLKQHTLTAQYRASSTPLAQIEQDIRNLSDQIKASEVQLKEVGVLQTQLATLQKAKDQSNLLLRQTESKKQESERQLSILNENCASDEKNLAACLLEQQQTTTQLSPYVDIQQIKEATNEFIQSLKLGAERYQVAQQKALSVETHIREIRTELDNIAQFKTSVDKLQPSWNPSEELLAHPVDDLTTQWHDLQAMVYTHMESVNEAYKQQQHIEQQLSTYYLEDQAVTPSRLEQLSALSNDAIAALRVKHQKMREELLRLTSQLESVEKELENHKLAMPPLSEEDTLEFLTTAIEQTKLEINQLNQLLGKLAQNLEIDSKNRSTYEAIHDELEKASKELERWTHLHKLFGSNDGKKFRNIAQSYVLEQLLVNANQYLAQFTNRYEMECQPGSLTILLRDLEAGGVLRPTTTISGGESFLISLSLALGLSSLSRSSFTMDTLFIDEGFGTLDSTYLSAVMDALERLHQIGGKKIGIISHVESLKERLTTQIQVTRINGTLSKIDVVSLI